jgi:hypothetical protein
MPENRHFHAGLVEGDPDGRCRQAAVFILWPVLFVEVVSCRSSNGCFINLHQSSSMGSKAIEPARHLSIVDVGKTRRLSVLAVPSLYSFI